ncbi:MAG: DUF998 domain-containing protein [Thermoplasmata archaeon]
MTVDQRKVAGLLIFLAAAQFSVGLMIAAALHPGYSISDNFISDLGVGPAAPVFNGSVILLGLLILAATYFIRNTFQSLATAILLALIGIGAVGLGVFTEDFGLVHTVFSGVAFIFAGVSAIYVARFLRWPLLHLSVILGALVLVALVLFQTGNFLGLGQGGMERMIVLPVLAWGLALGGYLMAGEAT